VASKLILEASSASPVWSIDKLSTTTVLTASDRRPELKADQPLLRAAERRFQQPALDNSVVLAIDLALPVCLGLALENFGGAVTVLDLNQCIWSLN
jgi:hypothetical protein